VLWARITIERCQSLLTLSNRLALLTKTTFASGRRFEATVNAKFNMPAVDKSPQKNNQQPNKVQLQPYSCPNTTSYADPPPLLFDMSQQHEIIDRDLLNSICNDLSSVHGDATLAQIDTHDLYVEGVGDETGIDHTLLKSTACAQILEEMENLTVHNDINDILDVLVPMLDEGAVGGRSTLVTNNSDCYSQRPPTPRINDMNKVYICICRRKTSGSQTP
jgi:hypothetical protein